MRLSQVKANSGSVFGVLSVDNPPRSQIVTIICIVAMYFYIFDNNVFLFSGPTAKTAF